MERVLYLQNRLWRKTRKPHRTIKFCVGTDANRNFDFHHAGTHLNYLY